MFGFFHDLIIKNWMDIENKIFITSSITKNQYNQNKNRISTNMRISKKFPIFGFSIKFILKKSIDLNENNIQNYFILIKFPTDSHTKNHINIKSHWKFTIKIKFWKKLTPHFLAVLRRVVFAHPENCTFRRLHLTSAWPLYLSKSRSCVFSWFQRYPWSSAMDLVLSKWPPGRLQRTRLWHPRTFHIQKGKEKREKVSQRCSTVYSMIACHLLVLFLGGESAVDIALELLTWFYGGRNNTGGKGRGVVFFFLCIFNCG